MSTTNSITGDKIQTKTITESYRLNYDTIFRKKQETVLQYDKSSNKEVNNDKETISDNWYEP